MTPIKRELVCEGYSSERYNQSLEELKSMFTITSSGLQPKLIKNESNVLRTLTGDIKLGENIKIVNLKINCGDEVFDISHSLLKLAWTTKHSEGADDS
ncbi:unnamed protein product [Rotaria magnacalcarata]|nr:unnamed protein product [Rotaria magnacalcarata]